MHFLLIDFHKPPRKQTEIDFLLALPVFPSCNREMHKCNKVIPSLVVMAAVFGCRSSGSSWETRAATSKGHRGIPPIFQATQSRACFIKAKTVVLSLKWIITTYICVKLDFYDIHTLAQTSADFSALRKPHIWFLFFMNKLHVNIQWQDTDVASLVFEPWRSQRTILSLQNHFDTEQLCSWN